MIRIMKMWPQLIKKSRSWARGKKFLAPSVCVLFILCWSGCTLPINYKSSYGVPDVIQIPVCLEVTLDEDVIDSGYDDYQLKSSIIQSIKADLSSNLFRVTSSDDCGIEAKITVKRLDYSEAPWGLLWLPLVYVGLPISKMTGEAEVTMSLKQRTNGALIDYYSADKEDSHWVGLYYGWKYGFNPQEGALCLAMEDIKKQVIEDKHKIMQFVGSWEHPHQSSEGTFTQSPGKNTFVALPPWDKPKIGIALTGLSARDVTKNEVAAAADFLRRELFKTDYFAVMDPSAIEAALEQQDIQMKECFDQTCSVELGKTLSVSKVVFGSLTKLGQKYFLEVSIADVETGKLIAAEGGRACKLEEIPELAKSVSRKVALHFSGSEE